MGDMGEIYKDMKQISRKRRENNRERSQEILKQNNIKFTEKNSGAHLIVQDNNENLDFWPGTGKFIARRTKHVGRGVFNLIRYITGSNKFNN